MSSRITIHPASATELDAVLAIQHLAYPATLRETRAAFAAKLARPNAALWLAYLDRNPCGYLLGFGCNWRELPQLDAESSPEGEAPTQFWYWHDLAIAPRAQGIGVARQLLHRAQLCAAQVASEAYLIAVDGAAGFWQRAGFEVVAVPAHAQATLASYGAGACLMRRAF